MTTTQAVPAPALETPPPAPPARASLAARIVAGVLIIGPLVAVTGMIVFGSRTIHLRDIVLAVILYAITGHGITVGYHRLFTHGSFKANRPLKIALAVAGSMAVEGSVVSWVAHHRRHHMFSDRAGDPHSPNLHGRGVSAQFRGFMHAHVGWLFGPSTTSTARFAPDLLADRDLARVDRLFPLLIGISLALPFGIGWLLSGTLAGAFATLLWAGLVRMVLLHHVTWSINSVCHMFGRRPFASGDRSTNAAWLSVLSMGESWHNLHHAYPSSARHGALPGQLDSSARAIRVFELAGWATKVRWPAAERLATLATPA